MEIKYPSNVFFLVLKEITPKIIEFAGVNTPYRTKAILWYISAHGSNKKHAR
jgi:hypothetical protein